MLRRCQQKNNKNNSINDVHGLVSTKVRRVFSKNAVILHPKGTKGYH